ncbi:MAG: hypothetical protein ACEPOZ_19890, partial [Marinifilaceae bacterium]
EVSAVNFYHKKKTETRSSGLCGADEEITPRTSSRTCYKPPTSKDTVGNNWNSLISICENLRYMR